MTAAISPESQNQRLAMRGLLSSITAARKRTVELQGARPGERVSASVSGIPQWETHAYCGARA